MASGDSSLREWILDTATAGAFGTTAEVTLWDVCSAMGLDVTPGEIDEATQGEAGSGAGADDAGARISDIWREGHDLTEHELTLFMLYAMVSRRLFDRRGAAAAGEASPPLDVRSKMFIRALQKDIANMTQRLELETDWHETWRRS